MNNDQDFVPLFDLAISQLPDSQKYNIVAKHPDGQPMSHWEALGDVFWIGTTICFQHFLKDKMEIHRQRNDTQSEEYVNLLRDIDGNERRIREKINKCMVMLLYQHNNIVACSSCISLIKSFQKHRFFGNFGSIGVMVCMLELGEFQ